MDFKFLTMKARLNLLIILLFFLSNFAAAQGEINNVQIVGNNIGTVTLKKNTLINVFRGRVTTWGNKKTVTVVLPSQKNGSAVLVAEVIYNTTLKGMQKFWLSLVFQGRANPPIFLDTDEEIIRYVQTNPGSIGVISKVENYPKNLLIEITN
jgi:ABC-type phosphate transport system substrate-binding protein